MRFIGYQYVDELLETYSTMELMSQLKRNPELQGHPGLYVTVKGPTYETRNVQGAHYVTAHLFRDLENERDEVVIWRKIMDTPAPLITKTFYGEDASQNHPIFQELEGLGLRLLFKKEQMGGWYVEGDCVGSASYV